MRAHADAKLPVREPSEEPAGSPSGRTQRLIGLIVGAQLWAVGVWLLLGYVFPVGQLYSADVVFPLFRYGVTTSRAGAVVLVLLCPLAWASFRFGIARSRAAQVLWAAGLCYVAACVGTYLALAARGQSTERSALLLWALTSGLLAARLCVTPTRTAKVMCALGSAQSLYALFSLFTGHHPFVSGSVTRAGGTFQDPAALYPTLLLCLPLAVALALERGPVVLRLLWAGASLVLFAGLVATWYRGGIIGATAGLTWLAYRLTNRRRPAVLTSLALGVVALWTCSSRIAGAANQASSDGSLQGRYRVWDGALELFRRHALTGVGVSSVNIPTSVGPAGRMVPLTFIHCHDLLLNWLVEMGIGGGVLFVVFVVAISRLVRQAATPMALGIGASWIALLLAGIVDVPFGVCTPQYVHNCALAAALLGATVQLQPRKQP